MEISGEYLIKIPRQQVWECLLDPNTLKACIPGCESLEKLADDNYQAQVKLTIGPVRATFQTQLSIKNAQPPKSYRLEGVGKGGAVGFGQGYAQVSLEEDEELEEPQNTQYIPSNKSSFENLILLFLIKIFGSFNFKTKFNSTGFKCIFVF